MNNVLPMSRGNHRGRDELTERQTERERERERGATHSLLGVQSQQLEEQHVQW